MFLLLVLVCVPVFIYTNDGTVTFVFSDPNATFDFKIDGEIIDLTTSRGAIRLRVGEHDYQISGPNFAPVKNSFTVKRGTSLVVSITVPKGSKPLDLEVVKKLSDEINDATKRGDWDKVIHSLDLLQSQLDIGERLVNAYHMRGDVRYDRGDYPGAESDYKTALHPSTAKGFDVPKYLRATILSKLVLALGKQGKLEEGLKAADEAVELNDSDAHVCNNRAALRNLARNYNGALEDCRKSIGIKETNNPWAYIHMAEAYLGLNEYEKALDAATKAIEQDKTCYEAYETRAKVYDKLNMPSKAEEDRKQAEAIQADRQRKKVTV